MANATSRTGVHLGPTMMVGILFVLLGASLAFVGLRVGGPFLGGSVAAFGAASTLAGVHNMTTRRHRMGYEQSHLLRDHTGVAAFIFGVLFLVPGLVLVVGGVASAMGMADGMWAWLLARPGPVVIAFGVWVALGGLGMLVSKWQYVELPTSWWQRLPGQLVGLLVMAMGVALVLVGRLFALDPENPREVAGRVAEWIARLMAGGAG